MRAAPVFRPDLLDAAGRSCDARVVDKRVQSAERGFHVGEEFRHIDIRRHVGFGDGRVRMHPGEIRQEFVRHIADMDFRAASYQEVGGRTADARGAGSDEDTQAGGETKDIGRAPPWDWLLRSCALLAKHHNGEKRGDDTGPRACLWRRSVPHRSAVSTVIDAP